MVASPTIRPPARASATRWTSLKPDDELRQLVADCEQVAAIPPVLRPSTQVKAGEIRVRA